MDPLLIRRDVEARADSILELAEFRSIIESATASMAALRRSDDDLIPLERAQHDLNAAQTKHESRIADTEFHLAIAGASGNRMLARAVEDARVQMFAPVDLMGFEFIKMTSVDAYDAILRAIRARDSETAAAAMREHISMTRQECERLLAGLI
jgi:GntR family transcriptional repressor for pyruvate dehydrogenase complex